MDRLFSIDCEALPPNTEVIGVRGMEEISRPYQFEVLLHLSGEGSSSFDPDAAIGKRATLSLPGPGQGKEPIHGVLTMVELAEAMVTDAVYRAVLMPQLWWLSLNRHSRVFVEMSIPEIIKRIFEAAGMSEEDYQPVFENEARDYPKLDHVCQYKESDLAFLARLMEREGIYYYFDQRGAQEKVILCDTRSVLDKAQAEIKLYLPQFAQGGRTVEAFDAFSYRCGAVPTKVKIQDYDYLRPDMEIVSEASPEHSQALFTSSVTTHRGHTRSGSEADRAVRVRSQEFRSSAATYHGEGCVYGLRPGFKFAVEVDPRFAAGHLSKFNQEYFATELSHVGHSPGVTGEIQHVLSGMGFGGQDSYRVQVTAIRSSVQYRPPRRTPVPRIDGVEEAVIDGPVEDIYAQLDDHGRYLVKVRFDEHDKVNGKRSMRVRMLQPHGGGQEGFHFPLRKGTEVALSFLGGDPDQPVIVGVAPNAHKPSMVTQANATQNVIQTGGGNRIVMEDTTGQQYVRISSPTESSFLHMGSPNPPNNIVLSTTGNMKFNAGRNQTITVGGTKDETIDKAVTQTYKDKFTEDIKGPAGVTIRNTSTEEIQGHLKQTVTTGGMEQEVTGATEQKLHGTLTETIDQHVEHTVSAGGETRTITGLAKDEIHGAVDKTVDTGMELKVGAGELKITAPKITLDCPEVENINPANWVDEHLHKFEYVAFSESVGVTENSARVQKADLAGFSTEITGFKLEVVGCHMHNEPTELNLKGQKIESGGTTINMFALILLM